MNDGSSNGGGMGRAIVIGVLAFIGLLVPTLMARSWESSAASRLAVAESEASTEPQVAIAAEADEEYCTPALRTVLRRVLTSCGLISGGGRGCQPADARSVATMSGDDFNALFLPMEGRGGILQFDRSSGELDASDTALIDRVFADRRGASYFFVVARASPDGSVEANTEISRLRAEAVMSHLEATFHDPELRSQVGLLWLGEEFAQLDPSFCEWQRSGAAGACTPEDLNRSAFVAWIDCRL